MLLGDPGQTSDDAKLNKFLELLEPSSEERAILLQDLSGEIEFEKLSLFMELIGLDHEEYYAAHGAGQKVPASAEQAAFADPWESKPRPSKRKQKRARVAAVSPLHAVGSAPAAQEAQIVTTGNHAARSVDARMAGPSREEEACRFRLQLVAVDRDGREDVFDVATLSKRIGRPEHGGLTLAESKRVPRRVQRGVVKNPVLDRPEQIRFYSVRHRP